MSLAVWLNRLPLIGRARADRSKDYDLGQIPWFFGPPAILLTLLILALPLQPLLALLILSEALTLLAFGPELSLLSWENTVSVEPTPPGEARVLHISRPWEAPGSRADFRQWARQLPEPLERIVWDGLAFDPVGDDFPRLMHSIAYTSVPALEAIYLWLKGGPRAQDAAGIQTS